MESRGNFSAVIWFMARSARFKAKTRISHQRRTRSAREDEMLDYPEQTAEREEVGDPEQPRGASWAINSGNCREREESRKSSNCGESKAEASALLFLLL